MIVFICIGGESIPDNPLDDLKGVNGTGPLYSRWMFKGVVPGTMGDMW